MNIIIPNILEDFVNKLNSTYFEFDIISSSFSADSTTFVIDNIVHTQIGDTVTIITGINEDDTEVGAIDRDANTLTVPGDFTSADRVRLSSVNFFHGTPYATNTHISRLANNQKSPMIYLYEIIREDFEGPTGVGISSELRLFFLAQANFSDWDTDQHYSNVIVPMRALLSFFVEKSRKSRNFFLDDEGGRIVNHAKFGVFLTDKGHLNSVFDAHLSGCELLFRCRFKCCNC